MRPRPPSLIHLQPLSLCLTIHTTQAVAAAKALGYQPDPGFLLKVRESIVKERQKKNVQQQVFFAFTTCAQTCRLIVLDLPASRHLHRPLVRFPPGPAGGWQDRHLARPGPGVDGHGRTHGLHSHQPKGM